jgi:hypothetical protein
MLLKIIIINEDNNINYSPYLFDSLPTRLLPTCQKHKKANNETKK